MNPVLPVIVPAVVGGLCWLVGGRLWNRHAPHEQGAAWGGAAAFAVGFFVAYVLIMRLPVFPARRAVEWLPYIAVLGGVAGAFEFLWGRWVWTRLPVQLGLSLAVVALSLRNPLANRWDGLAWWLWLVLPAVGIAALWVLFERTARRHEGASVPLACWAWAASISLASLFSASALYAQLAGAVAAVCGAAVVLAWWAPGLRLNGGAMSVYAPLTAGLLLQAWFFAEMPLPAFALLALAPVALLYAERRSVIYAPKWKAALIRFGVILVPGLVAAGIAFASYQQPAAVPSGSYYYQNPATSSPDDYEY